MDQEVGKELSLDEAFQHLLKEQPFTSEWIDQLYRILHIFVPIQE